MKCNKRTAKIKFITDHNKFFNDILENNFAKKKTKEVKFSSYGFYKNEILDKFIKEFCDNKKLCVYYGGTNYSADIPESSKLIPSLHAKVYWFLGFGAYIGSLNCTEYAFTKNIECGLWFPNHELKKQGIEKSLEDFFNSLEEKYQTQKPA